MARIAKIRLENYRSIGTPIEIMFPRGKPIVLLGENNAGKSNIVKALDVVLGSFWPGNHEPEDHEFFGRQRDRRIEIKITFDPADRFGGRYTDLLWRYDAANDEPVFFRGGPGRYGQVDGFVKNEDRDTCVCAVLEADRNLRYHLSYTTKWTFLSRLMHRFHKALVNNEPVRDELKGLFEKIKAEFGQIPEFAEFVAGLKAQLADLVGTMTHRLEVDFEAYNPVNFFQALRLQAAEGGEARTLEEMGTGEQQVLAMAFAYAYAQAFHGGIILVIEEPEAHLHPLAQDWLARRLKAMAEGGLQVLVTTHSPAFVDILNLEGLVLVTKDVDGTRVVQINTDQLVRHCVETGVPDGQVTRENVLPFYSANATREVLEGFFARAVVLVEGPTEALSLPTYLGKVGLDVAREGVAIVSVQGKGNLAKWRRLFTVYGIPCYIIFDNDASDDANRSRRRDALRSVGIHGGREDGYINARDWIVEAEFAVFGSSYEDVLRQNFDDYGDLENKARREGIESKPFISRLVAERLDFNRRDAGWQHFRDLAQRIQAKLPGGPAGQPAAPPAAGGRPARG